jgi:iron complex transport system substrate-binding protein
MAPDATPPRRIVSLLSSATEILCALGLGDRLVAVSHECDYPPQVATKRRVTKSNINDAANSRQIDDQVRQVSRQGEPLYRIDEPVLAACAPDLIVTQQQCDVCAVKYEDVVAAVARMDADPPVPIVALNPTSLDAVLDDILAVGRAAGCAFEADELVRSLRRRITNVAVRTASLPAVDRPRTVIIEWIDPLMLAANWVPEMLEIAGGVCPLVTGGQHSSYTAWQEVVEFDPQCILVSPCGFELARAVREAQILPHVEGWSGLNAVRQGRVFALDGNAYLNRSGPRIVDTLEIIAHLLHPDLFDVPQSIADPDDAWCVL